MGPGIPRAARRWTGGGHTASERPEDHGAGAAFSSAMASRYTPYGTQMFLTR